jgi:arsenate reductase-like glutaredoxin family protein
MLASAIVPGGGTVLGGVIRTGEKAAGKALLKKAGKETLEAVAEHTDEAAARRLLREAEERAKKEAEKRAAKDAKEAVAQEMAEAPNLPGRHGAFSQAKRDAGIPKGQQPDRIETPRLRDSATGQPVRDELGRPVTSREYVYTRPSDGAQITIQDHSAGHQFHQGGVGDQGPHFNVRPYGRPQSTLPGTTPHYPFTRKK